MPAYFVVAITIPRDSAGEKQERGSYDEYIARVKPIVESFGGTYLARSENISVFSGELRPDRMIIIEFADMAGLRRCFDSPEYKAVAGLRTSSVHTNAFVVDA